MSAIRNSKMIPVSRWEPEGSESDNVIIIFETDQGPFMVELSKEENEWLNRTHHPVYRRSLRSFVEKLSARALCVELRRVSDDHVVTSLIVAGPDGMREEVVPLTTALVLGWMEPVLVLVDPTIPGAPQIFREYDTDRFRPFLESISPLRFTQP